MCSQMRSCTPQCVAWPPIILKLERQAEWFEFFVGHVGISAFNNAAPRRVDGVEASVHAGWLEP